jgi:integrase
LKANGVREKRAKVFKEEKVHGLVEYLEQQISQAIGLRRQFVLRMDLAAVDYLWESWARGKECGELRVDEVDFEEGIAQPGWSKTIYKEKSATVELTGPRRGRFLKSAASLIYEMEAAGHDIGTGPGFVQTCEQEPRWVRPDSFISWCFE